MRVGDLPGPAWVHHDGYVTPLPEGHRFPMPKFNLLRDTLVEAGLATPETVRRPEAAEDETLAAVHDRDYIAAFTAGTLPRDAVRRIGLPWSPGLVQRTRTAVGGTILTARLALKHGLACNLAGGTHHAHPGFGSGFCIFNDLAVTAAFLRRHGLARHVLIVDLDVHHGDGTATAFADVPEVFTFSVHCRKNFPSRKPPSDLDIALPEGYGDEAYLATLVDGEHLDGRAADGPTASAVYPGIVALVEHLEPDLVLYDAGVDPHRDDALGKLSLSDAGLYRRDRAVIDACLAMGVPLACVIGGGYDKDHRRLAERHATVHHAAFDAWRHAASGVAPPSATGAVGPPVSITRSS